MHFLDIRKDDSQLSDFFHADLFFKLNLQERLSSFLQFDGLKEVFLWQLVVLFIKFAVVSAEELLVLALLSKFAMEIFCCF